MKLTSLLILPLFAFGLLQGAAGCSSSVGDGNTGGGAATGGGTDIPSFCAGVCKEFSSAPCGSPAECEGSCTAVIGHTGACQPVVEDYFTCIGKLGQCKPSGNECADEAAAITKCGGSDECLASVGTVSGGSCSGSSGCSTGKVEVACTKGKCTCKQGGAVVGTCEDPTNSCDAEHGCCEKFFD